MRCEMGELADIASRVCKGEGRFLNVLFPFTTVLSLLFMDVDDSFLFSNTMLFPSPVPEPSLVFLCLELVRIAPPNRLVISSTEGGNWTLEPNVGVPQREEAADTI